MPCRSSTRASGRSLGQDPPALADIAEGIDPSMEFRQVTLPGLFFVDPRPVLTDGEVGLPAASMASGIGGMGVHWAGGLPR
ncbi:hypothetical protein [Amycolatopsis pigmentata]|uniref:Uncharacterized protein n=1 Tax=Amycolatopsis pigmentata TaxID=450801 RepID=A0ABW5G8Q5_9PSEU